MKAHNKGTAQAQMEKMDIEGIFFLEDFVKLARVMNKKQNQSKELMIYIGKGFITCYNKESTEKGEIKK